MHGRMTGPARWLGAAALLLLGGCQSALLDPRGPVGRAEKIILTNSVAIMLAIVVPTIIATLAFAWWFRASNKRATYLPEWEFSGRIELVVWSIPIMVILLLGGVTWISSRDLDPARPLQSDHEPIDIQVVSLDWKWLFIYPQQGIATVNQLVVPAGTPVHFSITSGSVFNTFFVPRMGSMIYAMPGMVSQLNLQADRPAAFLGQSAHFSGDGFSDMQFQVRSVAPADYAAWVDGVRGAGQALDLPAYAQLARQSHNVPPLAFRAVDPRLFQAIATQRIPPAPGPQPENDAHAGREVSNAGGR